MKMMIKANEFIMNGLILKRSGKEIHGLKLELHRFLLETLGEKFDLPYSDKMDMWICNLQCQVITSVTIYDDDHTFEVDFFEDILAVVKKQVKINTEPIKAESLLCSFPMQLNKYLTIYKIDGQIFLYDKITEEKSIIKVNAAYQTEFMVDEEYEYIMMPEYSNTSEGIYTFLLNRNSAEMNVCVAFLDLNTKVLNYWRPSSFSDGISIRRQNGDLAIYLHYDRDYTKSTIYKNSSLNVRRFEPHEFLRTCGYWKMYDFGDKLQKLREFLSLGTDLSCVEHWDYLKVLTDKLTAEENYTEALKVYENCVAFGEQFFNESVDMFVTVEYLLREGSFERREEAIKILVDLIYNGYREYVFKYWKKTPTLYKDVRRDERILNALRV